MVFGWVVVGAGEVVEGVFIVQFGLIVLLPVKQPLVTNNARQVSSACNKELFPESEQLFIICKLNIL